MDQITRILEKLNQQRSGETTVTLADFMPMSLAEIRSQNTGRLSREEAQLLHRAAQKEKQNNILYTARMLTHANPLLKKEMNTARYYGATPYGYDDIIPPRAEKFVAPGAVSSMFSPAGYLTELYREARGLHPKDSDRNLDKRRPDLAKLVLSQDNLDNEISALSLANEQLETALMAQTGKTDKNKYYETLATSRRSGVTPYNAPFEGIHNALAQRNFVLPDNILSNPAKFAILAAYDAGISPKLYNILTEDTESLTGSDLENSLKRNFPKVKIKDLMTLDALANYYELPADDIQALIAAEITGRLPTPDVYNDDNKLVIPAINTGGKITFSELAKTQSDEKQADYIDLIPQGGNQFLVNFSVKKTKKDATHFSIGYNKSFNNLADKNGFVPLAGEHYSIPVTLDAKILEKKTKIGITRKKPEPASDENHYTSATFTIHPNAEPGIWLLRLNKTLRLAKVSGMTPHETQHALIHVRNDSSEYELRRFTETLLYRKRYGIDTETALMLCNAGISRISYDGQLSHFDRLFNNPPLNGVTYTLGGDDIPMEPDAGDPRREVLKRAFRVDNTGLWQLLVITNRENKSKTIENKTEKLRGLLFVRLLADVHNLTVAQLDALLQISPYNSMNVYALDGKTRQKMLSFLSRITQWLNTQNITVEQLMLLLDKISPAAPTKEMQVLLDLLRNGGIDKTNTKTLYTTMAPVITAAMQLDITESGEALLRWLDNNHPAGILTTSEAWKLIIKKGQTAGDKEKLAAWCQALAQRVLVIRTFTLSNAELQTLSQGAPAGTITELYNISDFHNLINRCGEQAGTVLDALQSGTLTVKILAQALNLSEEVITQALTLAGQKPELTTWAQLAVLPPRLDLADTLHITPKDITTLLTVSENAKPSYTDLSALAGLLQAGLSEQQTKQLQNQSEPRRNEALSGEYRSLVMNNPVADRDDIWRNLLVDGKVSAEITTTLLADAIAGIQLYINRTIAGDEPGADSDALERQFFKDWDACNKRYSTWAGVSQLVYYPENFVDPTLRTGQTGMMNTMLEQLSQSELNKDTLENGFRQYLTAFEQVADLKVVSGYHDTVNINQGNTWFIGTSQTEPKKYYWRKADHSKCQNGRFAANAWSDWKEITCAVNPYGDMVRPVIFHSRLYLLWIEKQVQKDNTGKDTASFTLKLTHVKYDGSWASPFSYDITEKNISGWKKTGLYCAASQEDNSLLIAWYQIEKETQPNSFGLHIQPDMSCKKEPNIAGILATVTHQLDTETTVRVNTLLNRISSFEFTLEKQEGNKEIDLVISHGDYTVKTENSISALILNPTAYINITPYKLFSDIPDFYREKYITHLNSHSGTVYAPESKKMEPANNAISDKVNACAVYTYNNKPPKKHISLSIGKNYPLITPLELVGRKLESFFIKHKETSALYYTYGDATDDRLTLEEDKYTISTGEKKLGTLSLGKMIAQVKTISSDDISMEIELNSTKFETITGSDVGLRPPLYPTVSRETLAFPFGKLSITIPAGADINNLDCTIKVRFKNTDVLAATTTYKLVIKKTDPVQKVISLYTTPDGAQYMEWDGYRTRLNTLFTRQLIERANNGIDAILSPETQYLPEPKPGQGTYVTLTLKPYDKNTHGTNRAFTIYYSNDATGSGKFPVYSGSLSVTDNTEVKLFIPLIKPGKNAVSQSAGAQQDTLYLNATYQKEATKQILLFRTDNNPEGWTLDKSVNNGTFAGLAENGVTGLLQSGEPMDFSGANALYFWELFYYTPMMVATRLLQEQNFTEANRWLSYIWQPAASGAGDWRVRPLKEDTSWNADPLDSVDPDAVAQNDPMHYKVSTLMKLLDLLIARGDKAYRMQERDTLNEAKMWYMQALGLLGDKPVSIFSNGWENPSLSNAADKTQAKQFHDEISRIRSGGLLPDVRTANTLTGLFRPQQNEKLLGYWQMLEMRLFNLRNNLSIDGQPLSLPIFAAPADPAALLSAAAAASGGSKPLPSADIPAMRFPQALDSARSLTGQLMQFGSTLLGLIERRDAEAMSELLQNQAGELMLSSLRMQEQALTELDAEKKTLEQSRAGAQSRFDSYRALYDENVSAEEKRTMDLYLSSAILSTSIGVLDMAAAAADMAPNIFGVAVGGSRWGGIPKAIGAGMSLAASATKITADNISQSEAWRRRRQEWEIQKNNAESEIRQIDAQLEALAVRRTATEMQREHMEIQQVQTQAQLEFLQRKFSNKALYSWLRGRLASIYYRFYDLTAARCMMAEKAYAWQTNDTATRYIKSGAWQSNNAGLMAGESLLLNLAEMEQAWLKRDSRSLEVTRTVSLAAVYRTDNVTLAEGIADLLKGNGSGNIPASTGLSMTADNQLHAAFNLKALNIKDDYPEALGTTRRIKQISVTLPALVEPYQDMRAIFRYGGNSLPAGCKAIALSHGINDDGLFRLDFNDGRWLPFEGIPVDDDNSLTLSFPDATGEKQKPLLLSLTDIIIHIRYTIC
ncbi:TPA: neuraminidase-like domain-containing protein [Morganella morganii]|uniref:Tc toxin subunit A-related protein n=2 Tax=Morganella morganii TaxID=582 RepID=UPI000DFA6335|nr:neuraminidase-like domain-containing protein [Morganella morganii]ELA7676809.1 insecticidal toxin protein [Morganella morganii]MBT0360091.1 insecticidal toxin protein [Morganella morganii subsp. morganii]MDU2631562.1 neuraminidase-like domain-containing protein [Morganella morganii]STZ19557.1 Salmonella virulence plasmid 28.1kDa A protein [Morganella morganii]HCR3553313.1 insecticidal toxin protein [Morganella morganii]